MNTDVIKQTINSLLEKAKELINDPNKRKDFIDKLSKNNLSIKKVEKEIPDLPILVDMIMDYFNEEYKDIEMKNVAVIVACLLYVMNTSDLIPDIIPKVGVKDDVTVTNFCISIIKDDLNKYKQKITK